MNDLSDLLRLIDAWRAARRAAVSDDYANHRAGYERRVADYALTIRTNVRGMRGGNNDH